ncbi:MAG: hypothetical protein ABR570_15025 [Burkholderiales bacterium]
MGVRPLALLAGLLAGCVATPPAPGDQVAVVWNRVDDAQKTCESLSGEKQIFRLRGCSKWNDTNAAGQRVCSIYTTAPRSELDTQAFVTLGHELMHCFDGNWHDRWGRMNEQERQAAVGASGKRDAAVAAD